MAQASRIQDLEAYYSDPTEDYVVVEGQAESVVVEINQWCSKSQKHVSVKLELHHNEARLLAEMLNRNAEEAQKD